MSGHVPSLWNSCCRETLSQELIFAMVTYRYLSKNCFISDEGSVYTPSIQELGLWCIHWLTTSLMCQSMAGLTSLSLSHTNVDLTWLFNTLSVIAQHSINIQNTWYLYSSFVSWNKGGHITMATHSLLSFYTVIHNTCFHFTRGVNMIMVYLLPRLCYQCLESTLYLPTGFTSWDLI